MLATVIAISLAMLGIAFALNLLRLARGPDLPDRLLALDTLNINALALVILLGIWLDSDLFFEAALLVAVFGFVSTVAVGKHLLHGDIID